jgi:hypothetical protein
MYVKNRKMAVPFVSYCTYFGGKRQKGLIAQAYCIFSHDISSKTSIRLLSVLSILNLLIKIGCVVLIAFLEIGNSHQLYNKVNSYHFHLIHIYIKYIIMWCFYAKYLCFWGKRTYIIWKCGFDLSILKYLYFPFIILLHLYSRNTVLCK